jgi:predicted dehydrogenase
MKIHQRMKELIKSGTFDELRYINFNFCFDIVKRGLMGFRRERSLGGGALYDLGIYGVDFIRYMTDSEPTLLWSKVNRKNGDGIDLFTHAVFQSGNIISTMTCSYDTDANDITLSCRGGRIYSPLGISGKLFPNKIDIRRAGGDERYEEHFPAEDPYNAETEYFAKCVENKEEPFLGIENSIGNMKMLEEIIMS